jgi:hypothetical protein
MKVDERPDGVSVIAIYYVFFAVMNLIGSCAILLFALVPAMGATGDGFGFLGAVFGIGIGFLFVAAGALLGLAAGLGLLRLKNWARILAIVLAIFSLLAFPIGTIIGGLIIWYLIKPEVKEVFH